MIDLATNKLELTVDFANLNVPPQSNATSSSCGQTAAAGGRQRNSGLNCPSTAADTPHTSQRVDVFIALCGCSGGVLVGLVWGVVRGVEGHPK